MHENRLIEIESKLAHQEQVVEELNAALTDQQARIADLESLCRSLVERLQSVADVSTQEAAGDERPPHY